jgi:hypothetical protein
LLPIPTTVKLLCNHIKYGASVATKPKTSDAIGKVKFRVIEFELEGTDASMQETIRGFTAALTRSSAQPVTRQLRNAPTKHVEEGDAVEPEIADEVVVDAEEVNPADPPAQARSSSPRPKKVVTYDIVQNIAFDDVTPTLQEFAVSKAPPSDMAKYLVIAYWFKHHKKRPDLKPEHFYTAYRLLGWKVPRDPAQPVRELRSSRDNRFSKGGEDGSSTINQIGENTVDALGKAKAD